MPKSAAWGWPRRAVSAGERANPLRRLLIRASSWRTTRRDPTSDARSADRIAMLNIERMVRDALFYHQHERLAYLSGKDLKTIKQAQSFRLRESFH